jgi:hypothetical protein
VQVSPREKEIVAALSRLPVEPTALERVDQLIGHGVDWSALIEQTARWEVEPAVFGNLRSHFPQALPPETLAAIAERERAARAFALSRTLQVVDLCRALSAEKIPALVLKGPAVAIEAYGDCSRRTFADIDLLVPKEKLRKAHKLVVARGYTANFGEHMADRLVRGQHALEFSGTGPNIEIHWSLLSRHLRFDLDPDELWKDAQTLQCADAEIRALSPSHLFLYLCAHGAKHEWMKFRWVCDVAQLARRLNSSDAVKVVEITGRTNSRRIVALAVRLSREMIGEEKSPFSRDAFVTDGELDSLAAVAMARIHSRREGSPTLVSQRIAGIHPYLEPLAFWIAARERKRDKLVCTARFIFEPAPEDRPATWFEHVLRPARIATNALIRVIHAS